MEVWEQLKTEFEKFPALVQDLSVLQPVNPAEIRRLWKISETRERHGSYNQMMSWSMTTSDEVAGGIEGYYDNVRQWARSIQDTLNAE